MRLVTHRKKVIDYIKRLQTVDGSIDELDEMIEFIEKSTSNPNLSNLIFGDYNNLNPNDIYDIAMR